MPVPVITIAQMRQWETATWAAGRSERMVIQRVGKAVARRALQLSRSGGSILILAGKGHNGDDARAARIHLKERRLKLINVTKPESASAQLSAALEQHPDLVIDGLFGIGLNRPLDARWRRFIRTVNAAQTRVLSVDVPSGLNGDTGEPHGDAINATITLTVGAPKRGLLQPAAWPYVGRLEVEPEIGLVSDLPGSELNWTLPGDFDGFPAARPPASHKGTFGHLAIIAGSLGYHGAAVLTSRGAQRAQPGLITVFAQKQVYIPIAKQCQAVMVSIWKPGLKLQDKYTAILIGPGLAASGLPDKLKSNLRQLWRNANVPVIVDASALDWLPPGPVSSGAIRLVTPHPGEAARLLKVTVSQIQADRPSVLRKISRRFGNCWVVLKGHQTLAGRDRGGIFVNPSGNPFLAQGGSGDLLSGYLAGLLAQPALQSDALEAIRYGVWQHGLAADRLSEHQPNWVVEDLARELGKAPSRDLLRG